MCTSRDNISPILAIEFLEHLALLVKDYIGNLTEKCVRLNTNLIYEVC